MSDDNTRDTPEPSLASAGYPQQVACDACGGSGKFCVGETLVSRDMAIDAECPSLEGTHYEYEFARCPTCGGDGWVLG